VLADVDVTSSLLSYCHMMLVGLVMDYLLGLVYSPKLEPPIDLLIKSFGLWYLSVEHLRLGIAITASTGHDQNELGDAYHV